MLLSSIPQYRAGEISSKQYFHHALLHWTGSHLAFDYRGWHITEELYDIDIAGHAFWKWQHEANGARGREPHFAHLIAAKWQAVPKIDDLEAVFRAYATGRADEVEAKLSVLTDDTSILLQRVLCLLALRERKLGILELCLRSVKNGMIDAWQPNRPFEDLSNTIERESEPELYLILKMSETLRSPGTNTSEQGV